MLLHIAEFRLAHVHGAGDAHLLRQVEAVGIDVGDDGVAGAGVADDGGGHDADGAGAGDEHILTQHGEGKRRVDGVAEGVEDGGDVERHVLVMPPDIGHGQGDVLGECARAVHADTLRVRAEMASAGQAIAASPASDVAFTAHDVAGEEVQHVGADFRDAADELVTNGHGHGNDLLGPIVPLVNMHVGAADTGPQHLDENVVDSDFGDFDVFEPQAGLAFTFHQGFHNSYGNRFHSTH